MSTEIQPFSTDVQSIDQKYCEQKIVTIVKTTDVFCAVKSLKEQTRLCLQQQTMEAKLILQQVMKKLTEKQVFEDGKEMLSPFNNDLVG